MRRIALFALLVCMLVPAFAQAAEWHEKLKLKGDVRFRNELIQQEDKEDNFRWRMRARLAAEAEINETWSAAIGLASGSDDPVSTNQTLTSGFSRKYISIDLAYVDFHPKQIRRPEPDRRQDEAPLRDGRQDAARLGQRSDARGNRAQVQARRGREGGRSS